MSNMEIHEQIDKNNDEIISIVKTGVFTLNKRAAELIEKNKELQKQCTHNFVDGKCEFCYIDEDKDD